ncbi:MAG: RraA family protein [Acidobacteria bacterium]|nr:RraA family protein [Acidobacteriota bacterium]
MKKLLLIPVAAILLVGFQQATRPTYADPLLNGFAKSTVASVADAVDQITGQRGYMSHDMRPRVGMAFVGRATTAILKPAPPEQATAALSAKDSVAMIDAAKPGEVGIIVVEGSLDLAGMGGLMATAAKSRNMAGIVLDGGVRDIAEIRSLGLPVFARSVSPGSSVGRWASVGKDIPVTCGGIKVTPGDIIVAGEDGVVVVPKAQEQAILKRSQEIDDRETKMVPFIKQFKSLTQTVQKFNRI